MIMRTPESEVNHKPALVVAAAGERRMSDAWRVCFRAVRPLPWEARDRSRGRRSMHMALADMRIAIDGGATLDDALAPVRELEADVRFHFASRHAEPGCVATLRTLSHAEAEAEGAAELAQLEVATSETITSVQRALSCWRPYFARVARFVDGLEHRERELSRLL